MNITFDRAIELLEIADISKVTVDALAQIGKKARRRWHPDKVAHLNDPKVTAEYTQAFQQLDLACEMVKAYLEGDYHGGDAFTAESKTEFQEPAEVIRKAAPDIQAKLKRVWATIKAKAFKKTTEKVQLSDGFKLRDLLDEDLKDDIAFLSMVSLIFGGFVLGLATGIVASSNPTAGGVLAGVTILYSLGCILGAAPLSRFWLPAPVSAVVIGIVNFGLRMFRLVAPDPNKPDRAQWVDILVSIPVIIAKLVKWFVVWPLFQIAKAVVGDKVVGVVFQEVIYYAGAAEWYAEELLNKNPNQMTEEELLHLSHLYTELSDVPS